MNVKAIRYILEDQPGFVVFQFKDIHQKVWTITEKLPVLGLFYPRNTHHVPFEFDAPSQILEEYMNRKEQRIFKIRFLYDVQSDSGETEFEVFEEQYYD